jgi:hypothetical protein
VIKIAIAGLSCAVLFCVPAFPASAGNISRSQTAYQASVTGTSCANTSACIITFPSASAQLRVERVSCSTSNGQNDYLILPPQLSTVGNPAANIPLMGVQLWQNSTEDDDFLSTATLFFVSSGDAPVVSLQLEPGGVFTTNPTCVVSGELTN